MKRILAWALLCTFLLASEGMWWVLSVKIGCIRTEVKNRIHLKQSESEWTFFTHKDLEHAEWVHAKEFWLNGKLYDIAKSSEMGKWCYPDDKEAVYAVILNEMDKDPSHPIKKDLLSIKFLPKAILEKRGVSSQFGKSIHTCFLSLKDKTYAENLLKSNPLDGFPSNESPPPEQHMFYC